MLRFLTGAAMNKDTGGSAFPVTPTDKSGQIAPTECGMTLRDYFAAKAMQGMFAADTPESSIHEEQKAKFAYQMADLMIKERSK